MNVIHWLNLIHMVEPNSCDEKVNLIFMILIENRMGEKKKQSLICFSVHNFQIPKANHLLVSFLKPATARACRRHRWYNIQGWYSINRGRSHCEQPVRQSHTIRYSALIIQPPNRYSGIYTFSPYLLAPYLLALSIFLF